MTRRVYLDYSATTPVRREVLETMLPYFHDQPGNASSLHWVGQEAKHALESSRRTVARVLGAQNREIYFTSGGTEGDNQAITGLACAVRDRGRHIITSAIEHHAVLHTVEFLKQQGWDVTILPVDEHGLVHVETLRDALRRETVLVSIMLANNEIGTIEPVAELVRVAHEHGAWFHTDAVQAMGKMPVRVDELGVDLLSLTAHKFSGPKGIGVLYVRSGTPVQPLLYGGSQEGALRPGTQNVAGIVGLTKALELATEELASEPARWAALRDRLQESILSRLPAVRVNGHPTQRLPNILNISIAGVEGESLLLALDVKGVAVSTGSACAAGSAEASHILQAIRVPAEYLQGSLRLSLGHETTEEDVDYAADALVEVVEALRAMSPMPLPPEVSGAPGLRGGCGR